MADHSESNKAQSSKLNGNILISGNERTITASENQEQENLEVIMKVAEKLAILQMAEQNLNPYADNNSPEFGGHNFLPLPQTRPIYGPDSSIVNIRSLWIPYSSPPPPPPPVPEMRVDASHFTAVRRSLDKPYLFCGFCKNNRETKGVYESHTTHDEDGRTTCPQLRSYTCKLCGATGDKAHTDSHCPTLPRELRSSVFQIKTERNASGKIRTKGKSN